MKIAHRSLLALALAALATPSFGVPLFPCGIASSSWDDISVTLLPAAPAPSEIDRRERVEISVDLAAALGIVPADLHGAGQPNPQIRLRTQSSPAGSGIESNNSVFTVMAINPGVGNRVWVHRRNSGTDRNAGEYKLFAIGGPNVYATADADANGIIDNILVKAYPVPVSKSTFTSSAGVTTTSTYSCEPAVGKSYVEKAIRKADDRVVAIAPHGGNIEAPTSTQAMLFASTLTALDGTPVNTWNLEGLWGDNQTFQRWHVTSPTYDIASYPGLVKLLPMDGTFDRAVSFHGFGGTTGSPACPGVGSRPLYQVIIGGSAERNLKCAVAQSILAEAAAQIPSRGGEIGILIRDGIANIPIPDNCLRTVVEPAGTDLGGLSPANIVNRLTSLGGIQLEQSSVLRGDGILANVVAKGAADGFRDFAIDSVTDYCDPFIP